MSMFFLYIRFFVNRNVCGDQIDLGFKFELGLISNKGFRL